MSKKRFGDRKDGKLIRDIDPMHYICPLLYPNRCDNEAYISFVADLTKTNEYLARRNESTDGPRMSPFAIAVAAIIKTLYLRPKMNRFIANRNVYQRNEISASFVIRKHFTDESDEGLAFVHSVAEDTLETLFAKMNEQISASRAGSGDSSSDSMDLFNRMPRFISRFLVDIIRILDKHGKVPQSLIDTDPYYSSILLSYLGSVKLKSAYHHLTNWGTNSVFIAVGEKKLRPFYDRDGAMTLRDSLDFGLTIDERLADGYYYSKTIRLFKKLVENPELLELPMSEEVVY